VKYAARAALVCGSLCFFTPELFAQTAPAVSQPVAAENPALPTACRATVGPVSRMVISGPTAPYSALRENSSEQTLADGTHISHKPISEKIYRDSQGRLRTERPICQGPAGTPDAVYVEIHDPVSGFAYILDEQNQIAHRYALKVMQSTPRPVPAPNASVTEPALKSPTPRPNVLRPSMTTEPLGTQTLEGVSVEGTRTTEIIPEGFQGNDRPMTIVRENWTSPELKVAVLMTSKDPRFGEHTMRLTNIELSEPILALFLPPPGYKIVDETERVMLTFGRPLTPQ
jgi:hypothetical protein